MSFMTMNTFGLPISVSDADTEMIIARKAGWRRADLAWERLQEQGNAALRAGQTQEAIRCFRRAAWISRWRFRTPDPRRAATLANLALADRLLGREARARRRYAKARRLWEEVDSWIGDVQVARRARSSLFHLRMEARHWDTYQDNLRVRLRAFARETGEALAALEQGRAPTHRLFERWRGEKPSVFDDTRKVLAAALMIAAAEGTPPERKGERNGPRGAANSREGRGLMADPRTSPSLS